MDEYDPQVRDRMRQTGPRPQAGVAGGLYRDGEVGNDVTRGRPDEPLMSMMQNVRDNIGEAHIFCTRIESVIAGIGQDAPTGSRAAEPQRSGLMPTATGRPGRHEEPPQPAELHLRRPRLLEREPNKEKTNVLDE